MIGGRYARMTARQDSANRDGRRWASAVLSALSALVLAGAAAAFDGAPPGESPPAEASGDGASYWTLYRQRRLFSDARLLDRLDREFCAFRDAESRTLERRTGVYEDRPSGPAGAYGEEDCAAFIQRHAEEHRAWYAEARRSAADDKAAAWRDFCAVAPPRQPLRALCAPTPDQQARDSERAR
jgi:hypothetical protein